MSQTAKRYIKSSIVTFLTGFCGIIVLELDNLSLEVFKAGGYVGLLFSATRAGIKALAEWFLDEL